MNRTLLTAIILLALGLPAMAQVENPKIDIFGGYSHVGNYNIGLNGWIGTATWHVYKNIGIEGDVSGGYGSSSLGGVAQILPNIPNSIGSHMHNFDFGPSYVYRPPSTKYDAFGHLLFGFSHTNVNAANVGEGDTAFSWVLGGGADYNLTPIWAVRAQLDVLHTDFFNAGQDHGRISFGVVYRFGK